MYSLQDQFEKVENLAKGSKLRRLLQNPSKYIFAIFARKVIYPLFKRGIKQKTKLFFGKKITVTLPAGSDIYLTGGKAHDSEIRLTKFILKNLAQDDVFIDVGAHFGFFTRLASE